MSLLFTLAFAALASEQGSPASSYPRPVMFRSNTPENVEALGHRIGMMVSDHHVPQRRYSDELFKERYPASRSLFMWLLPICPRDAKGQLDWLRGELGEVVKTSKAAKTVTVRRFETSRGWPELPAGSYLASNASRYNRGDTWGMTHTPKGHPYHVPVWPWICDGFALDVTAGNFLPNRGDLVDADCNNDGVADQGQVNGVNHWGSACTTLFITCVTESRGNSRD